MPRYVFAVEGCAEHFEHPDDATAVAAAFDWARTGFGTGYVSVYAEHDGTYGRLVETFKITVPCEAEDHDPEPEVGSDAYWRDIRETDARNAEPYVEDDDD